jgi:hypothetical protein
VAAPRAGPDIVQKKRSRSGLALVQVLGKGAGSMAMADKFIGHSMARRQFAGLQ